MWPENLGWIPFSYTYLPLNLFNSLKYELLFIFILFDHLKVQIFSEGHKIFERNGRFFQKSVAFSEYLNFTIVTKPLVIAIQFLNFRPQRL